MRPVAMIARMFLPMVLLMGCGETPINVRDEGVQSGPTSLLVDPGERYEQVPDASLGMGEVGDGSPVVPAFPRLFSDGNLDHPGFVDGIQRAFNGEDLTILTIFLYRFDSASSASSALQVFRTTPDPSATDATVPAFPDSYGVQATAGEYEALGAVTAKGEFLVMVLLAGSQPASAYEDEVAKLMQDQLTMI